MAVSELGWCSLAEAELYFADERLEVDAWTDLSTDDKKNKALNMAYNRIFYCPLYSVPEAGTETAAQLIKLIIIQSEMAYYMAVHLADEDRRKGLQTQAVISAGIVKEDYDKDKLGDLPIPPIVDAMLEEEGFKVEKAIAVIDVDRDEDEDFDYDAT